MIFNGDPNKQDIVSDADFWAGTDEYTFPLVDKVRSANFALDRVTAQIMRFDRRWKWDDSNRADLPVAVRSIVAGQDNYTLEIDHLKILRVRIKNKNGEWRTLQPKDRRTVSDELLSESGQPFAYDKLGRSIFPLPVPDYSAEDGLEIEFQRGADYFVLEDGDREPGFASQFHRLVSLYMAEDFLLMGDMAQRLTRVQQKIQIMEAELQQFYEQRDIDDEPRFNVKKSKTAIGLLR